MTWPITGGVGGSVRAKPFNPNRQHIERAELLNEGEITDAYYLSGQIRITTQHGKYPYVWIKEDWLPVREGHVEMSEYDLK